MDMTHTSDKVGSPLAGSSVDILSSGDFELVPPSQHPRISPSLISSGDESIEWCVTAVGYAIICNR